ncbi:MAG: hypothetical protein R6W82_07505 [bacterium]
MDHPLSGKSCDLALAPLEWAYAQRLPFTEILFWKYVLVIDALPPAAQAVRSQAGT